MLNAKRLPHVPASVRNWVREQMVLAGMPADTWRSVGTYKLRGQMVAALLVAASMEPQFTQRERDIALAASTKKPDTLATTFDPAWVGRPCSYTGIVHETLVERYISALVVNDTDRIVGYRVRKDFRQNGRSYKYTRRLPTLDMARQQLAMCLEAVAALPKDATAEQKHQAIEAVPLVRLR